MGHHGSGKSHCNSNVRYVQGGLCEPGNGSKCYPYNSLALAEADHSWKKLVVLPSPVPLDGGISLRAGTELVGSNSPVHGALEWDQPAITNTSSLTNGGNGVVVQGGDVKIKNIYFLNTQAAAINYDNAHNIKVKNVLVTGQNQGQNTITVTVQNGETTDLYIGGLQAVNTNYGETNLCNVVIRDFDNAQGVFEGISEGAYRLFKACKVEVSGLSISNTLPGTYKTNAGIGLYAIGHGSRHKVSVKECNFHDYSSSSDDQRLHGVSTRAYEGGYYDLTITDTRTYNLGTNFSRSVYMFGNTNDPDSLNKSKYDVLIEDCVFEEPDENRFNDSAGIQQRLYNSIQNIKILNNKITNIYDSISNYIGGTTVQDILIEGNDVKGDEAFCLSVGANFGEVGVGNTVIQHITIRNNNYAGGFDLGAIIFGANLSGPNNGWADLVVNATGNCFIGDFPVGFIGILAVDFTGAGGGNGTINAHNNNFVNFDYDIVDGGLAAPCNFDYFAQGNFWDGNPEVLNQGTGVVDVSNPLVTPIVCPEKKYCSSESISPTSIGSENREDRMNKAKLSLQKKE